MFCFLCRGGEGDVGSGRGGEEGDDGDASGRILEWVWCQNNNTFQPLYRVMGQRPLRLFGHEGKQGRVVRCMMYMRQDALVAVVLH